MTNIKKILISLLSILALAGMLILWFFLYHKNGWFLPDYIHWTQINQEVTFDEENVQIILKNKKLSIRIDEKLLYKTADDVFVSNVFCNDIDHDGSLDVCMLVWKKGSFGEHKPFWISEDSNEYSQHIFIYHWDPLRDDRLDPLWMSSDLGIPVVHMDIDQSSRILLTDTDGVKTSWAWFHWGLVNCD